MARPKKKESEKRKHRLTIYLTENEDVQFREVVGERDLAKCAVEAIQDWIENERRRKH